MKIILLSSVSMLFSIWVQAQSSETLVKDFNLEFSSSSIEVSRGESGRIDLTIQKSKQFQKGNVKLGTGSSLPKGVTIVYEPSTGVITSSSVSIATTTEAVPGTYNLILNGTINQKTKGVIVKLIIL
ncbi:MAG TPA: hypothetical protein VGK59_19205 [Ohtaekwangia sp.]